MRFIFLVLLSTSCSFGNVNSGGSLNPLLAPNNFVSLHTIDNSILLDIRYHGYHNFIGDRIDGYHEPICIITRKAAHALSRVQRVVKSFGMTLKVYDCYRPQMAVDHFLTWSKNYSDVRMKNEFYPREEKSHLVRKGYIAKRSSHSRGSTVDVTLVPLPVRPGERYSRYDKLKECTNNYSRRFKDNSIDMGTGFDCFDRLSQTNTTEVHPYAFNNRQTLKRVMEQNGFKNYSKEWWHYTLRDEPFKNTYFDFPVSTSSLR